MWYNGDATDDWDDPDGYEWKNDRGLTEYYLNHLGQYLAAGLPVFNCEYAVNHADTAYAKSYEEGLIPYVTRSSLS